MFQFVTNWTLVVDDLRNFTTWTVTYFAIFANVSQGKIGLSALSTRLMSTIVPLELMVFATLRWDFVYLLGLLDFAHHFLKISYLVNVN
jgi:hypothetical protein